MDIFKVIGIGIIGGILSLILKEYRKEFSVFTAMATAVIILMYVVDGLYEVISSLWDLAQKSGVDKKYFIIVIKVVGVAYITQFACEILRDSGENAVALKVELAGKVFVLGLTVPIISGFIQICIEAVGMI